FRRVLFRSGRYGAPSRDRLGSTLRKLARSHPEVIIRAEPSGATSTSRPTHAMSLASVTAQNRSSVGPARRSGLFRTGVVYVSPCGSSKRWSRGAYGRKPSGPSRSIGIELPAVGAYTYDSWYELRPVGSFEASVPSFSDCAVPLRAADRYRRGLCFVTERQLRAACHVRSPMSK